MLTVHLFRFRTVPYMHFWWYIFILCSHPQATFSPFSILVLVRRRVSHHDRPSLPSPSSPSLGHSFISSAEKERPRAYANSRIGQKMERAICAHDGISGSPERKPPWYSTYNSELATTGVVGCIGDSTVVAKASRWGKPTIPSITRPIPVLAPPWLPSGIS